MLLEFDSAGMANRMTSSQVCAAVGRRFHPRSVGAARIGLEMGRLGLRTTPYLATSVPHIYAAGDAAGNRQLTPVAAHEGRIAAINALRGDVERADEAVIPQVLFTTPEVGLVGLSYAEAPAHGIQAAVGRHDARGASNSVATGDEADYFKLVFDQDTQRLIGAEIVSSAAAELIQLCALAVRSRVPAGLVAGQLSVHPSHGERLLRAFAPEPHGRPPPRGRGRSRIAPVTPTPLRRAALWLMAAVLLVGCAGSGARASPPPRTPPTCPRRAARCCATACA